MSVLVRETASLSERATQGTGGRWTVTAISAGLGSSGYYSPDVLEDAASRSLIEAGTPLFFDHPSESERTDRPERSVRDIAAVFTTPASYDAASEALVGEVQVFGPYRELVSEMAPHIGLSISGSATDITEGVVDGRKVPVVEGLFAINSVDLVTKAGRGGHFMSLLESARAETDRQAEAAGAEVSEATYSDMQTALCDAVKEQYGGEKTYAWVRDFDDETVWFEVSTNDSEGLYGQGYSFDTASGQASLTGDRTEVRAVTTYQPVGTASASESAAEEAAMTQDNSGGAQAEDTGSSTTTTQTTETAATEAAAEETATEQQPVAETTHTPSTPEEAHMTDTTQGAGGTAPAQEAGTPATGAPPRNPREVMERQLAEQGRQISLLQAQTRARDVVAEVLATGWIGEAQRARLASSLVGDLPLTEAGELDEQALRDRAQRGLDEAETEAAEILSAAGVGSPRGLGALTTPATETAAKEYEDSLRESFKARGMSDAAIEIAVKGR